MNHSINKLPFRDNCFDIVIGVTVIGQRGINDQTAINELVRVTKPTGYVIVVVSAFQSLSSHHDKAVHLLRRYSTKSITTMFNQKVQIIENHYIFSFIFSIFLFKRLTERVLSLSTTVSDLALPPKLINECLIQLCQWEWKIHQIFPLPFGSSILTVARKHQSR